MKNEIVNKLLQLALLQDHCIPRYSNVIVSVLGGASYTSISRRPVIGRKDMDIKIS